MTNSPLRPNRYNCAEFAEIRGRQPRCVSLQARAAGEAIPSRNTQPWRSALTAVPLTDVRDSLRDRIDRGLRERQGVAEICRRRIIDITGVAMLPRVRRQVDNGIDHRAQRGIQPGARIPKLLEVVRLPEWDLAPIQ